MREDYMDRAAADWRRERPDLDPAAVEVSDRIQRIANQLQGRDATALVPLNLGPPSYAVLAALRRSGEPYQLTPTELRHAVGRTSGAMTNRIDRLEKVRLVKRHRPARGDRRSILIRLTPAGLAMIDEATPLRFAAAERALSRLSARELSTLRRLLHKVATELE
jgi:DNA-binding MarR family transcriptional regulator